MRVRKRVSLAFFPIFFFFFARRDNNSGRRAGGAMRTKGPQLTHLFERVARAVEHDEGVAKTVVRQFVRQRQTADFRRPTNDEAARRLRLQDLLGLQPRRRRVPERLAHACRATRFPVSRAQRNQPVTTFRPFFFFFFFFFLAKFLHCASICDVTDASFIFLAAQVRNTPNRGK